MKKIIMLVAVLTLTGCSVNATQIEAAQDLCKEHQGVSYMDGTFFNEDVDVKCVDNTRISLMLTRTKYDKRFTSP